MRIFCYFADQVVLTGPFSAAQVSRYDRIIPYAREVSELKKLATISSNKEHLIILHVPTEPVVKGTPEIEKAFKKLGRKYPKHQFKILPRMNRPELLKEMGKADIIIDQIIVGWYGGQAVEAMAMGKVVMAYLHPPYLGLVEFGDKIPIINTNAWTLEKDLENVIENYSNIAERYRVDSIKFAKKYHDSAKIAEEYLKIYEKTFNN